MLELVSQQSNSAITSVNPEQDAWVKLATDWLLNLRTDKTRNTYRDAVRRFFAFAECAPAEVTQSIVIRWVSMMNDTLNAATVNTRLSAVASFYAAAVSRGLISTNPCDGVTRRKVSQYGRATWLDGESGQDKAFLKAIDRETVQGKRDYAIMLLYLTLGVRVSAIADARVKDLREAGDTWYLTYVNKGGKLVEVKLPFTATRALYSYLEMRQPLDNEAPLFIMTDAGVQATQRLPGNRSTDQPLTPRTIQKLVRKYADIALGKGHGITPHSLRHTAALNAAEAGSSTVEIMNFLQHSRSSVTDTYLQGLKRKTDTKVSQRLSERYED